MKDTCGRWDCSEDPFLLYYGFKHMPIMKMECSVTSSFFVCLEDLVIEDRLLVFFRILYLLQTNRVE